MEETSTGSPIKLQCEKIEYVADPIHTLRAEIIQEIFLRLPVKSLLKFRCVSKSWLSLISSPQFREAHLEISTNDPELTFHRIMFTLSVRDPNLNNCSVRSLLYEPVADDVSISFPGSDSVMGVNIVGSCNGLICISIYDEEFFVWNRSLRKSKKLPDVNERLRGPKHYVIYGFGFDEINKDYKVILDPCLCAQGKLHWYIDEQINWDIGYFDLGKETCGVVEQPKYETKEFFSTLGVLGGCLCVIFTVEKTRADVWVLKDYHVKESWTKIVSIPSVNGPRDSWFPTPLCISRNGEVLLAHGSSFIIYNAKENSFRFPQVGDVKGFTTYVESLVSPDEVGE